MNVCEKEVRGINILNPVDVDREYYLKAINYAIENDYNHIQLNGPIHNLTKSNLDGMMFYKKYSRFNGEKDAEYIKYCMEVVNEALEKSHKAGIKTYMWHHELEIPFGFQEAYPEILNEYGDVEVSHPRIRDFLENKLRDFFESYPLMDGFVVTYYETKVPLMRLKKQKLTKEEIMTYITGILYETCKRMGKSVIVRTDATLEDDYRVLLNAYEKVAMADLMIMDKWTQYDWSLTLPSNYFIRNITKNPLVVETDLFGEYFGKGKLPLMLKDHIKEQFAFCEQYKPAGYCSRIDRGGFASFGTVNEVNLHIMKAMLNGLDPEETICSFFRTCYGNAGEAVKAVMEKTEEIVRKLLFANGYYYSELSWFPTLNHSKNHFYFELMRDPYKIASDEWFVPVDYERGEVSNIFADLNWAQKEAERALQEILKLKGQMESEKFERLRIDFQNLELASRCWLEMAKVFYHYVRYFDEKNPKHKKDLWEALFHLTELDEEGKKTLPGDFYGNFVDIGARRCHGEKILDFVREVKESFACEEMAIKALEGEQCTDYVVCGGGCEGHALKKEVNFSDTLLVDGALVRIPGNKKGMEWSTITAHGWFSYRLRVKPGQENVIEIVAGSSSDLLKMKVTVGGKEYDVEEPVKGMVTVRLRYEAEEGETTAEVKIEKISAHMPLVHVIKMKEA